VKVAYLIKTDMVAERHFNDFTDALWIKVLAFHVF